MVSFQSRFQDLVGKESSGSRLVPALVLSVAFHFLVLWPDVLPRMDRQAGQPLTATLRAPQAVEHPAPLAQNAPPPAKMKTAENIIPGRAVVADAGPVQNVLPSATEGGSASAPAIDVSTAFSGGTGNSAAPPGASAGLDADGIRAYRIVLAREARAHRYYPPLARERGWTGTAEVSVDVSREGRARQILLARSSGHDVLDREAVHMMSRAAAAAVLPDSLRGREFAVRLPVVFDIAEIR